MLPSSQRPKLLRPFDHLVLWGGGAVVVGVVGASVLLADVICGGGGLNYT